MVVGELHTVICRMIVAQEYLTKPGVDKESLKKSLFVNNVNVLYIIS